jgi:hypothetical protein
MIEDSILTKKKFATLIEDKVFNLKMTYMDAILTVCSDRELDPGDIAKLVSPVIKDKLEAECIEMRLLEGTTSQLPV